MNGIKLFLLKHWKLLVKLSFAVVLFCLIFQGAGDQIRNVDYYQVTRTVRTLPTSQIAMMVIFGLLVTASMTLYDYAVIRYFKHTIRPLIFFNMAFVANSLNNLLGMGGLAGAAVRTILLRKNNLDFNVSLYYNVLLTPSTPTGLSLLGLWCLLWTPKGVAGTLEQYPWLYLGICGVILILPAYFFSDILFGRFRRKYENLVIHRAIFLKIRLVGISLLEWLAAFLFFRYVPWLQA